MSNLEPTRIGKVRHVLGANVTVALDTDLAGVSPIYRGRLHAVGQIGSLVRIPQGLIDLVGLVKLVGIAELAGPLEPSEQIQHGERWLQVQLIGEINHGTGYFERGIGSYPSLEDSVHFATAEELNAVFPKVSDKYLRLGRLSSSEDVPVCLDVTRLVVRHGAVVGSTGSGKTSAVASLLQSFISEGWKSANIVVIDPHGEYSSALGNDASVRSVLSNDADQLQVPYWALPASDIARIFIGASGGATFARRFEELVADARRDFAEKSEWLSLDRSAITSDTPVPFDIRRVWYQLDFENRRTVSDKSDPESECIVSRGDPENLVSAKFEPYGAGGTPPHKSSTYGLFRTIPDTLRLGLLDPHLSFFQQPEIRFDGSDPLIEVINDWLGGDSPISVLDFSGVPVVAADLAIGVVLNLLFEVARRGKEGGEGIGRPRPVYVVLEEAHRYLGKGATELTRNSANRIAREGRKYGAGILMVTQRPTELPATALSQCGTIIALRLSNAEDQGEIRAALPDAVEGLSAILPSLRTGEAVISGESVVVPCRVLIDKPDPEPDAHDPSIDSWRSSSEPPKLAQPIKEWRGIYQSEEK